MPIRTPILALCGTDPGSGNAQLASGGIFPDRGPVTVRGAHEGERRQQRLRGLPWGVGDPAAAFLDGARWAVVRIDDAEGPIPVKGQASGTSATAAVDFASGMVLYRGDPRGAIETLVQHGADRAAMSVGLALPDDRGIAAVGSFGVAVAGDSGLARGGASSHVLVPGGYGGVAVAGRGGRATVGGSNGIAAVGAGGYATASGLAIARDAGGWISAREPGVAVALASVYQLDVGAGGIAVGLDRAERISIGSDAVAVVRDATASRIRVTLGEGALIVIRYFDSSAEVPRFTVARGGPNGLEPDIAYIWVNGVFQKRSEYVPREGDSVPVAVAPMAESPGDGEWVLAGADGTAVAGPAGLASGSRDALAGDGGIAITGGGTARVGHRGVAICDAKRYGTAEAGNGGVAVGLGSRFGMISAGTAGAAIYGGAFGIVSAGDRGVAIGGSQSDVRTGRDGVAIATDRWPSGEPGSLLVRRGSAGDLEWSVVDRED